MYELMDDGRLFFTANPINRYAIGDRTSGLRKNADGSIDILIQHEPPGGDKELNWLPAKGPIKDGLPSLSAEVRYPRLPVSDPGCGKNSVEERPRRMAVAVE